MNYYQMEHEEEYKDWEKNLAKEKETQQLFKKAYGDNLQGMLRNRVFTENMNYLNNPNW